ncbi:TetR/AcrR family transcriptional regulator [Agromyces albus]|uniref:TetR/AcrR family transcriptional regulator n=1 Tax=Agromyces albus TaxID=205332 RepID=A0A4Q2KRB7_9MICO|nr:TetR/AcrR family transcriptional regulator [Agromyces albus]RXZ67974.1 TetR/AcrR family transcriptional regulator [Agromyces albus]
MASDTGTDLAAPARRGPYAKTAKRRQEIVDAATNVFATRGYHGGSLRDISRQIGLSLTSVVHHFPAKSDLLAAVLENADHSADWFLDRARAHGVKSAILDVVRHNLDRPELLRLLAIVSSEASDPEYPAHGWFVKRYENLAAELERDIAHDIQQGRVPSDVDPEQAAHLIIAVWDGLQLQWLLDPAQDMPGRMDRALDRLLG